MADITPVTREEMYLAKAGGQDVPTPTPVPREEQYLAKLSGQDVNVPTPITRREKFLYAASGGDIELPSEDKMRRIEKFMAKAGGMDVSTPTAVTRLEKFWANVEAGGWKTITGVLPLTFTAKGGTAVDWAIYGNDEPGENLFDKDARDTENGYVEASYLTPNNTIVSNNSFITSEYIPVEHNSDYYLSRVVLYGTSTGLCFYDENKTYISGIRLYAGGEVTTNITTPNNCKYIRTSIQVSQSVREESMIIKGSTPPDHYIPYQIGVGERTENLYGVNASVSIGTVSVVCSGSEIAIESDGTNTTVSATAANWKNNLSINLSAGSYGYKIERMGTTTGIITSFYDANNTSIGPSQMSGTFTLPADTSVYMGFYIPANTTANGTIKLIMTAGSTAPTTYIPYGYQIPILCEHTISDGISYNEDKLLYFDGSVISQPPYQTTSDFIAVTQKEITISGTSVSSVNKLVRLCEYDENKTFLKKQDSSLYGAIKYSFTFALGSQVKYIKYSLYKTDINIIAKESNDYTFYIGDSPLTEGETVSKTSTGQDIELFEGENVVSTTLYNKPTMEIKYK